MKHKTKSLGVNAFLSSLKTLTNILFPLITYPYITRILTVDSIGSINFSQSIVSYFSLLAALGITTFAVRTGSRIRDNQSELQEFASRVFSINILSTVVSVSLLLILIFLPTKISEYRSIILILSVTICLSPFSVDWLYIIQEDFAHITLRNLIVHFLSLIFMFCFVKTERDVYEYVLLITASTSFGNVFNYIRSKKYFRLKFVFNNHWKEYRSTILLFFVNSIATTIYLNSDTTILGLMCSDYIVGLYSVATKIYSIFKQMFNAVVSSTIPRLSYLQKKNDEEFFVLIKKILHITILVTVPAAMGILLLRKEIILIISGAGYLDAAGALGILSVTTIFAVIANLLANGVLVCLGREKCVLKATAISATFNILLNFFFIPMFKHNGTAATTMIAEIIVFGISLYYLRDYLQKIFDLMGIINAICGSAIMCVVISYLIYPIFSICSVFTRTLVIAFSGLFIYVAYLIAVKDRAACEVFTKIKKLCIRKYTSKSR